MLVALAVFSLAALALVRLQGVTLRTAADLDSKALGQIVANWRWRRIVKPTDDQRLLQVDLTVDGQPGASPVVLSFVRVVE